MTATTTFARSNVDCSGMFARVCREVHLAAISRDHDALTFWHAKKQAAYKVFYGNPDVCFDRYKREAKRSADYRESYEQRAERRLLGFEC